DDPVRDKWNTVMTGHDRHVPGHPRPSLLSTLSGVSSTVVFQFECHRVTTAPKICSEGDSRCRPESFLRFRTGSSSSFWPPLPFSSARGKSSKFCVERPNQTDPQPLHG